MRSLVGDRADPHLQRRVLGQRAGGADERGDPVVAGQCPNTLSRNTTPRARHQLTIARSATGRTTRMSVAALRVVQDRRQSGSASTGPQASGTTTARSGSQPTNPRLRIRSTRL